MKLASMTLAIVPDGPVSPAVEQQIREAASEMFFGLEGKLAAILEPAAAEGDDRRTVILTEPPPAG